MSPASEQAVSILRHTGNMQWYVVPLLIFVIYAYITEIERKNWPAVTLGIAFWAGEFIWEMFNALVLKINGWAPMWSTPGGNSAYVIYVGLNIEIAFFFAVAALLVIKALPADRSLKILGLPNRLVIPMMMGLASVFVEVLLNRAGLLVWDNVWWQWPNIWLIIAAYCLPFLVVAWCHDHLTLKAKTIAAVGLPVLAVTCHLIFATWLSWI
ncbi:MAG: hypothetical protein AB1724_02045 [Thermodesulfobacteriota bacterium]